MWPFRPKAGPRCHRCGGVLRKIQEDRIAFSGSPATPVNATHVCPSHGYYRLRKAESESEVGQGEA